MTVQVQESGGVNMTAAPTVECLPLRQCTHKLQSESQFAKGLNIELPTTVLSWRFVVVFYTAFLIAV